MTSEAERWKKRAAYDMSAAQALLEAEVLLYVPFCCQQAVEKMLKARIIELTGEMAPKIHPLLRLAELARIELTSSQAETFEQLSLYYIYSRYPMRSEIWEKTFTVEAARNLLAATQEIISWLNSMR